MEDTPFSYDGCTETDMSKVEKLIAMENGFPIVNYPIRFNLQKPKGPDGQPRDQTGDAARHMRYAHTLGLPEVTTVLPPRMGRAIIVGGAPSIADELETIRALATDPDNAVFAVNWSHTWLINNGVIPKGCVLFEIDTEPESVLKAAHKDVTYYICSHCSNKTFDDLANFKRILWHSPPNSPGEKEVAEELFKDATEIGGGVGTFTRTLSIVLALGFRSIELFGCDSSFPDDSESTHVKGYETANRVDTDAFYVYAKQKSTEKIRRFKTVGYLALQVEEFKEYCRVNHHMFALRVHGDSLLRYAHSMQYPNQYE